MTSVLKSRLYYFGGLIVSGLITYNVAGIFQVRFVDPATGWNKAGWALITNLIDLSWLIFVTVFSVAFWGFPNRFFPNMQAQKDLKATIKIFLFSLFIQYVGIALIIFGVASG